jgi:hypothetical protein
MRARLSRRVTAARRSAPATGARNSTVPVRKRRAAASRRISLVLGLCLVFPPLAFRIWPHGRERSPLSAGGPVTPVVTYRTVTETLCGARWRRTQAREVVKREMEAREQETPGAPGVENAEELRRRLMSADKSGELQRAVDTAARAEAMSHTASDRYRVAELQVLLQCDAGHHRRELLEARKLVDLRPDSPRAWMVLRRAAICNRLEPLRRRAEARLQALEGKQGR